MHHTTVRCVECDVLGTAVIGDLRCWCCDGTNVVVWAARSAGHRNNPNEREINFYDHHEKLRLTPADLRDDTLPWQDA